MVLARLHFLNVWNIPDLVRSEEERKLGHH